MRTRTNRVLTGLRQRALDNPHDVAAHLVLADALMSDGDELGEYISRTANGYETPLPPSLELRLLGRLRFNLEFWNLEYGFLRAVGLSPISLREFRALIGLAEWEGVTQVSLNLRRHRRRASLPPEPVLALLTHPACRHLREIENLGFDAFLALCELEREYHRLHLIDLPHWGVNTPLERATLRVRELEFDGDSGFLPWLKTWGREVFDRVEVFRVLSRGAAGLDLFAGRLGAACRQVHAHDWDATKEGDLWHFELHGFISPQVFSGLSCLSLVPKVCEFIRKAVPVAGRFTIHLPDLPEEQFELLRANAGVRPVEFRSLGPARELDADGDAPF